MGGPTVEVDEEGDGFGGGCGKPEGGGLEGAVEGGRNVDGGLGVEGSDKEEEKVRRAHRGKRITVGGESYSGQEKVATRFVNV